MDSDRMREIGTCGGCGLIARRVLSVRGGTPLLRYDGGCAVHAAVRVDGEIVHLGEDWGLVEVSREEFARACREDFDPSRLSLDGGELDDLFSEMGI